MVEIIFLIFFTNKIGNMVKAKGHPSGWYKVMAVALWFGGEITGAILGVFLSGGDNCVTYITALAGAAAGAGITYLIANNLSTSPTAPLPIPGVSTGAGSLPAAVIEGSTLPNDSELSAHLQRAEELGCQREFEQASLKLEEALKINPLWGNNIAGYPRQTRFLQEHPISGYALLIHLAASAGRKDLAVQYFRRMLN